MNESNLTHLDDQGAAQMVHIGDKPISRRSAVAEAICVMQSKTSHAIRNQAGPKGEVLQVVRVAAIQAAKRTDELIPLCHSVPMDSVSVEFEWLDDFRLRIRVTSIATGKTGVEMEALVGASVAGLVVYDMCKAIDRSMSIEKVELVSKTGGRRGDYHRPEGRE